MNEIKLPQLGQSVEEASIIKWCKQEGESVEQGETLFSIQTDKAEIECESTASGVLRKIIVPPDELVPVLTVVALVGTADEPMPDLRQYSGGAAVVPTAQPAATAPMASVAPAPVQATVTNASASGSPVSPRARRVASELGVDPTRIQGTGAGGRVMEADVVAYAGSVKATPMARKLAQREGVDLAAIEGSGPHGRVTKADVLKTAAGFVAPMVPAALPPATGEVRRTPLTPMRKIIAQRMCESLFTAPHYFVTVEVDMTRARQFRGTLSYKASFNDLVMRAVVQAIQQFPQVNARWAGDAIEELGDVNLGVAVALPNGLIVPVVKRAQAMSLQELSKATRDMTEKAKTGKLTPDDYSGNTFTISNLGAFGVDQFTAIINQPDSAILAVGQIKDSVVVIDGGIQVRPIAKLTLSSDHRVIDGAVAAQFMGALKKILESADF